MRFREAIVSMILGFMVSLPMLKLIRDFIPMRFSLYLASLGFYHWAEYLYVSLYHYPTLNFDSKRPHTFFTDLYKVS